MTRQKAITKMMRIAREALSDPGVSKLIRHQSYWHGSLREVRPFKPSLGDLMIIRQIFEKSLHKGMLPKLTEDSCEALAVNTLVDYYLSVYSSEFNRPYQTDYFLDCDSSMSRPESALKWWRWDFEELSDYMRRMLRPLAQECPQIEVRIPQKTIFAGD